VKRTAIDSTLPIVVPFERGAASAVLIEPDEGVGARSIAGDGCKAFFDVSYARGQCCARR
jgi:hypothetical protein